MSRICRLVWACFSALALAAQAQPAINPGASGELPLRNLLIEVRQLEQDRRTQERQDATATVRVQPGNSSAALALGLQATQAERSGSAQQQALVLNGRRTAIVLRNTVGLRVLQSFQHQGRWVTTPGTLWLQAGTGFDATPRWDGGDTVELELATLQGRNALAGESASTRTSVMLPLGVWMAVAESDETQDSQQGGLGNSGRSASQSRLQVQVRVSLR
jgi:hypothetical protein